jgi:hypothetical protein
LLTRDSVRSRTLLLGALLATAALLAACSSGPPPLVSEGFSGHECGPSALGKPVTDGSFILANTGTSPVTVTSVRLPSPHGVTMTPAWLMPQYKPPHGSLSYVGDGFPYPPATWPTWPDRQAIPGAVIKSHQELNLFFGITRTADRRVQAGAPVITYTADGNTYTLQTHWAYILLAPHNRCPR